MTEIEKLPLTSMDIKELQLAKLKELFPEVFTTRNQIDWEKLKQTLGEDIDPGKERFGMNWSGKADCYKTIQQPSIATLIPAREESIDFDNTQNLFIEGDNLEVLKLLQKSYLGKIKMMYFDPPYNTGSDFIYPDNFSESIDTYLKYTGQADSEGKKFYTNPETDGRFHSKWMNMIYPRLFLSKNLLSEDGIIFISIGQTELSNLILICNEIFGEENRAGIITRVMKSGGNKGKFFSPNTEYIIVYAKNILVANGFKDELSATLIEKVYTQTEKEEGDRKGEIYRTMGLYQSSLDPMRGCTNQRYFIEAPDGTLVIPPGDIMPTQKSEGGKIPPKTERDKVWRWTYPTYFTEKQKGNIEFKKSKSQVLIDSNGNPSDWNVYTKIWLTNRQEEGKIPVDFIDKFENRLSSKELQEIDIPFDFAKPSELLAHLVKITGVKENEILLDIFAGSASSAHGLIKQNTIDGIKRKFIMVQLPELIVDDIRTIEAGYKTVSEIGKERIRRVIQKIKDENEKSSEIFKTDISKLDLGFKVFKLAQSNFNLWNTSVEKNPDAIAKQLELNVNNISDKSTQEDILFELLLKSGFEITTPIKQITLANKIVFSVAEGELLICLDKELNNELLRAIAGKQPSRVLCLDEGFKGSDELKTNAVKVMQSKGVVNFRTV